MAKLDLILRLAMMATFAGLLSVCGAPFLVAQIAADRNVTILHLRLADGKFEPTHMGLKYPTPSTEQVLFLKNSVIQEELELSPTQIRQLEKVLSDYVVLEGEILALVSQGNVAELSGDSKAKLQNLIEELGEKFSGLLLPHQQTRLGELIVRCVIRRDGMIHFLFGPRMERIKEFEFTNEQVSEIFRLNTKIGEEYAEKVQALKNEYLDAMEAALPKHAQDAYAKTYQEFLRQRVPPLDLVAWQLENREKMRELLEHTQKGPQDYSGFFRSSGFSINVAGRLQLGLESTTPPSKERESQLLTVSPNDFLGQLSSTILSLENELDLTDQQVGGISAMLAQRSEFVDQHLSERARLGEQGASAEEIKALKKQFEDAQNRMAEEALVKLDSMLTPIQKEALTLMAEGAEFIYCGFPFALEFGNAGKRLKLTAAERDAIRAEAEKFMERIKEETREWEQEILDRFLEVMNEKQQEKLKKMLGDPLQHTGCDMEIFITTLLSPRQNY